MAPARGRRAALVVAVVLASVASACGSDPETSAPTTTGTGPGTVDGVDDRVGGTLDAAALCAGAEPSEAGTVQGPLREASGLAASRGHPGVLWSHDDSGGAAEVFAIGPAGGDLGRVALPEARALDWEDLALLPGDGAVPDRLVLADTGDNPGSGARATTPARLVVVPEPEPPGTPGVTTGEAAVEIAIAYADGPRDAETLLADPLTGDVLVVSKQWDGGAAGVYRVPAAVIDGPPEEEPVVLDRESSVGGSLLTLFTGGDVSPDGSMVALRTYADVRLWDRGPDQSVAEALAARPVCHLVVDEPQGEAVAFTADGRGLVTVSEGGASPLLVRRVP